MILCLVLASGFWIFTSMNETYESEFDYQLEYTNAPKGKIAKVDLERLLKVKLKGKGWDLFSYLRRSKSNALKVNLSVIQDEAVSESDINDLLDNEVSGNNINVIKFNPKEIPVSFEKKFSRKVPLILNTDLTFKEGYYQKGNIKIVPDSILVSGPESLVEEIKVWETDTLKLETLSKAVTKKIGLRKTKKNITFDNYLVNCEINVIQFTEKKLNIEVDLTNANLLNLLLIPSTVELKCMVPVDEYDNINEDDFSIVADYKNNKGTDVINLTVARKPVFINQINFYPNQVDYINIEGEE